MKTWLSLLGLFISANILAEDLSIKVRYPKEQKQLKAGDKFNFELGIYREDEDSNLMRFVTYYKWNNETPTVFKSGAITNYGLNIERNLVIPNLIGQSATLCVYLVSELDSVATNDTIRVSYSIADKYANDLKISLITPGKQANVEAGEPLDFQFKIHNTGSETFTQGSALRIYGSIGSTTLFTRPTYLKYLGNDLESGDSTLFDYIIEMPEDAILRTSALCVNLYWVEHLPDFDLYAIIEDYQSDNEICRTVNSIGLGQKKLEVVIQPQLNLRNQQLSFFNKAYNLPYNSIQVFNISGQLLMSNAISGNQQAWNFPTSESTVVVLLSGPKESYRELIVAH